MDFDESKVNSMASKLVQCSQNNKDCRISPDS